MADPTESRNWRHECREGDHRHCDGDRCGCPCHAAPAQPERQWWLWFDQDETRWRATEDPIFGEGAIRSGREVFIVVPEALLHEARAKQDNADANADEWRKRADAAEQRCESLERAITKAREILDDPTQPRQERIDLACDALDTPQEGSDG